MNALLHCCGKAACEIEPPSPLRMIAALPHGSSKKKHHMLQFFRNFFKSKVGIVVTLAFLALIAFAFTSAGVSGSDPSGISGSDSIAVIGDRKLDATELSMNLSNALDQARQNDPRLTMQIFIANGGLENVLKQTLERSALAEFGKQHGIRAGSRLIDSEILQISAFRGLDGEFDQAAFSAILIQRGLTESGVREDIAMGLFARQLVTSISLGARPPLSLARRYATLLRERREGSIALLPSEAFAPGGEPNAEQLQTFYDATRDNYIRPERRVIRYAVFGDTQLGELRAPTGAEIKARYDSASSFYTASEKRSFTQLIMPTEAAAKAIVDEISSGRSLAESARSKGLATSLVGPISQEELSTGASAEIAKTAFATPRGRLATPTRGSLGWYILRVESVETTSARSLEQVRGDISRAIAEEQRQSALADLTARIEDELDDGRSLSEVAEELGVEIKRTAPATADGRIYGSAGQTIAPELSPVLQVAYEMDEGEPQLAETNPGITYVVFDVSEITQSQTAPLAEITGEVTELWRRNEGSKAARNAADRVIGRLGDDQSLQDALQAEDVQLPRADTIDMARDDISRLGSVPPVLALMFSMAQGTTKKLEMPSDAGWFVVQLDDIKPGEVAEDDSIIAATVNQLGEIAGDEYLLQFVTAVEREVNVERNQAAIDALSAQLTGQAN